MRKRVLRIFDERFAEEVDGSLQTFFAALAEVISTLQVQVMRCQILR